MSTFFVGAAHVDALLDYIVRYRLDLDIGDPIPKGPITTLESATLIGQRLLQMNWESHNRVTTTAGFDELISLYTYSGTARILTITTAQAAKAASCLDYQCSDHPDWKHSPENKLVRALKDHCWTLVDQVSDYPNTLPGHILKYRAPDVEYDQLNIRSNPLTSEPANLSLDAEWIDKILDASPCTHDLNTILPLYHINALTAYTLYHQINPVKFGDVDTPDAITRALDSEHCQSVRVRAGRPLHALYNRQPDEPAQHYAHQNARVITHVQALVACATLVDMSRHSPTFAASAACNILRSIDNFARARVPSETIAPDVSVLSEENENLIDYNPLEGTVLGLQKRACPVCSRDDAVCVQATTPLQFTPSGPETITDAPPLHDASSSAWCGVCGYAATQESFTYD